MVKVSSPMGEDYWKNFQLHNEDTEFLYNHLLELETPLTSRELVEALIGERIRKQTVDLERQRTAGGDLYQPNGIYEIGQTLIFPVHDWKHGKVTAVRSGRNPELRDFQVIDVIFEDGEQQQFAANMPLHKLNAPPKIVDETAFLDRQAVMNAYEPLLMEALEENLQSHSDIVRIAGRWFPRALLLDVNMGHLNLAEAVLEVANGGPLSTSALVEQIELNSDVNPKLVEFSMDLALQEDQRFDEVGPSGDILWFLRQLEPPEVLNPPIFLRYHQPDYDRSKLKPEMLVLEQVLDDELSPVSGKPSSQVDGEVHLIFPHWRAGTLPLSTRIRHLFPTAYEAPRVRFKLVDGDTGEQFPGWVVRESGYVFGLLRWYESKGVMPGSILRVRKGKQTGEVMIHSDSRRPSRDWVRTVLVGSDGGIVFAMLKQLVSTPIDERMAIAVPDKKALDQVWQSPARDGPSLDRHVFQTVRELSKLNPQSHVHAIELYAAINITRRAPPGPILSVLATQPWFQHVGDQHYRLSDVDID